MIRLSSDTEKLQSVLIRFPLPSSKITLAQLAFRESLRLAIELLRAPKSVFPLPFRPIWTFDSAQAALQLERLRDVFKRYGVSVITAGNIPGCWSQCYVRDVGFVVENYFFVCRPWRVDRRREKSGILEALPEGLKIVELGEGHIEGGDVFVLKDKIILGVGEYSDKSGFECLRKKVAELGIKKDVAELVYSHYGIIHLDTKFNAISEQTAIVYPGVFSRKCLSWIEKNFDVIEATREETRQLQINVINLSPASLVMQLGSDRLARECEKRGFEIVFVDFSEFIKGFGSFRCATLSLVRGETPFTIA